MVTFLQKMEEDGVIPNIKTLTLLLEVAISDRHHEDVNMGCYNDYVFHIKILIIGFDQMCGKIQCKFRPK